MESGIGGDVTSKPCYEWTGGDVSMDFMSAELEMYKTLDVDTFRGFGYDESSLRSDDE